MSKRCSSCGAPAPDDTAVFCNRCGAQLPVAGPSVVTCRKCGRTVADPQSRFCDKCGAPVAAPAVPGMQPVPPSLRTAPAVQGSTCPACGFLNAGENVFFCKKCGTSIPQKAPAPAARPQERAPVAPPVQAAPPAPKGVKCPTCGFINTAENVFYCRKCGVYIPVKTPAPAGGSLKSPVLRMQDRPAAIRQDTPGAAQEPPRARRQEAPQKEGLLKSRKVWIAVAGVVLLILGIVGVTVVSPDILAGGSSNTTDEKTTAPGLFDALSLASILPNQTPAVEETLQSPKKGAPDIGGDAPAATRTKTVTPKPTKTPASTALNEATAVVTDETLDVNET
jgi:hypothetical protein